MTDENAMFSLTPQNFILHRRNAGPFNEDAVNIEIVDEGGGPFILLSNAGCRSNETVRLECDELIYLAQVMPVMLAAFDKDTSS